MNISNINDNIIDLPEQTYHKKVYINHFQTENKNPGLEQIKQTALNRIKREQSPLKPLNLASSGITSRNDKLKLAPIGTVNGQTIVNNPDISNEDSPSNSREFNKYLLAKMGSKSKRASFPSLTNDMNRNQNENTANYLKILNTPKIESNLGLTKMSSSLSMSKYNLSKPQIQSCRRDSLEPFLIKGNNLVLNNLAIQIINNEQKNLFEAKVSQYKQKSKNNSNNTEKIFKSTKTDINSTNKNKLNNNQNQIPYKQIRSLHDLLEPNLNKSQGLYTTAVTSSSQLKIHHFNSKLINNRSFSEESNIFNNNNNTVLSNYGNKNIEFIQNEQQVSKLKRQFDFFESERQKAINNSRRECWSIEKQLEQELKKNSDYNSIGSVDAFKFYESDKVSLLLNKLKPVDVNETKLKKTIDELINMEDDDELDDLDIFDDDDDFDDDDE